MLVESIEIYLYRCMCIPVYGFVSNYIQLSTITHTNAEWLKSGTINNQPTNQLNNNKWQSLNLYAVCRLFFYTILFNGRFNSNIHMVWHEYNWEQYVVPAIATCSFCFVFFLLSAPLEHWTQHTSLIYIHFWNWILTSWRPLMIYVTILALLLFQLQLCLAKCHTKWSISPWKPITQRKTHTHERTHLRFFCIF